MTDHFPADERPADERPADERPADERPADERRPRSVSGGAGARHNHDQVLRARRR